VPNEAAGGDTSVQIPKTKSVVPGCRECVHAIRGDDNVGHEVVVAVKNSFWRAVTTLLVPLEIPENNGLVYLIVSTYSVHSSSHSPRDAVKSMSGFSDDEATAVTHPL
jgi:hypothetical protein